MIETWNLCFCLGLIMIGCIYLLGSFIILRRSGLFVSRDEFEGLWLPASRSITCFLYTLYTLVIIQNLCENINLDGLIMLEEKRRTLGNKTGRKHNSFYQKKKEKTQFLQNHLKGKYEKKQFQYIEKIQSCHLIKPKKLVLPANLFMNIFRL